MRGQICGTGSCLPKQWMDNEALARIVDTDDVWIRERTGIAGRYIAEDETTASMAVEAGRLALENGGIAAGMLDMILVSTMTPNSLSPCTACIVQEALGAEKAVCFDLNAACSGFVFAYLTAQAYISAGICRTVLIIGSETLSAINNWQDRGSCILFGDGAGAAVLQAAEGENFPQVMHSAGGDGHVLTCESRTQHGWKQKEQEKKTCVAMDGRAVFRFAVRKVPEAINELLAQTSFSAEDIDWFVLHQANQRIIEAIARRMKADISRFPMNIRQCGNTSSASIGILLDEMNRQGLLKTGQKMVLAGFGAGLSWGAALLEWQGPREREK